jgi:sterol desaturase/sphingolipid hydroxylase (fatty acid hydroxylase superfamily)
MAASRPLCMETLVGVLIPLTFVAMLVLERLFPARQLPVVRGWLLKGTIFFLLGGAFAALLPALASSVLGEHAPLNLSELGTIVGGVVGFAAADLVTYAGHRIVHNVPLLWRWSHQMHHSAERLDVAGSAYFHPLDNLLLGGLNALTLASLGLSPSAAALAGYLGFFAGTFQHLNLRTPQWLGWIIQRPEAHAVHHSRGVHAYNYGNLMLWDLLFGTFRNPAGFSGPAGFWDGASNKLGAMLIGRDVGVAGEAK